MVYPYDEVEAVIFGPACRHSHERRLNFQVAGLIPLLVTFGRVLC